MMVFEIQKRQKLQKTHQAMRLKNNKKQYTE